jgi:glycosyltransferase involved in cell wall biosynthesis
MSDARGPQVEIVVPVRNEERELTGNVTRLVRFLQADFPCSWLVTVADNGSADDTWALAQKLSDAYPGLVRAVHLDLPGRGRALRTTWSASAAEVVAYMDVDLSTDLRALFPLVAPLLSGHSDVAIGTRLARGARVVRGPKREFISRAYNLILRAVLRVRFTDAQCGFKAVRATVAWALLPLVEDQTWFFDTELLVLAERAGLRIHEVPVDWTDSADSRVRIVATALGDLRGVGRLRWGLLRRSLKVPALKVPALGVPALGVPARGDPPDLRHDRTTEFDQTIEERAL